MNDWYDGRIDDVYPVKCYREAIKNTDEQEAFYSSLPEDLTRALQSAIRTKRGTAVVPAGTKGRTIAPGKERKTPVGTAPRRSDEPPTAVAPLPGRREPKGFFPRLLDFLGPNNADSIPLPLIFLAGLALVLTAAGAAGMVTRHVQAKRAGPGASPPEPPALP